MNKVALKSLYLSLLHSTMIARSLGVTFQRYSSDSRRAKYKKYLRLTFREFESLRPKIEKDTINREDIRAAINRIKDSLRGIEFGQAQKGLNVLLKYHCLLFYQDNKTISQLDCPLDSKIQEHRWGCTKVISLAKMIEKTYDERQTDILQDDNSGTAVAYDLWLDEDNLQRWGLDVHGH